MSRKPDRWQRVVGWTGIAVAMPVFAWALLGLVPGIPSMVEVFGIPGLRIPASVAVGGLLLAAIGFWDY